MSEELPEALASARVRFWTCSQHRRGRVEWGADVAYCLEQGCGRKSSDPAPIDWPDRFRKAADVAVDLYVGTRLAQVGVELRCLPSDEVEAIGRALLGETP
jgi:hypothetical protein